MHHYSLRIKHVVPPSNDGAELLLVNSNPAEGSNADAGISYIISNSYVKGKKMLPAGAPTDAEAFATQIAIWAYLFNKYPTNTDYVLTQDQIAALVGADTLYYYDPTAADYEVVYEADTSIYKTYIEPVVLNALKASFTQRVIITKGNDNITKVDDGKYYFENENMMKIQVKSFSAKMSCRLQIQLTIIIFEC